MSTFRFAALAFACLFPVASMAQSPAPPAKPAAKAPAPKKETILDYIKLANGDDVNGVVKVEFFEFMWLGEMRKVKKADVRSIEYARPPRTTKDTIQVGPITRIDADVLPKVIPVEVQGIGLVNIPKSDIHTLVIFADEWRSISEATRKALAGKKP